MPVRSEGSTLGRIPMATPRKIREYVEATDVPQLVLLLTETMREHGSTNSGEYESDTEAAIEAEFTRRLQEMMFSVTYRILGEEFTDAELDELIAFVKSPVAKKARELMPMIQGEMLTMLSDKKPEIDRMMKEITREILSKHKR